MIWRDTRPRVHKEIQNEDQDQDLLKKLSLLDQISYKLDEMFTILSGGLNWKAIETEVNLAFLSFEIMR